MKEKLGNQHEDGLTALAAGMDLNSTDESGDEGQAVAAPPAVAVPLPQAAEEAEEAVEVVEEEVEEVAVEVEEEADGVEEESEEELQVIELSGESGDKQGPEAMDVTVVVASSAAIPAPAAAAAGPSTAAGPPPTAIAARAPGWRQATRTLDHKPPTKSAEQPASRAPVAKNNRPKPVAAVEPDEKVASGCAACAGGHRKHTCGQAALPPPAPIASTAPKAPKTPKAPKAPKGPKAPRVSATKPVSADEVLSGLTVVKILGYKAYPKAQPGSLSDVYVRLQFSDGRTTGHGLVDPTPLLQSAEGVAMLAAYAATHPALAPYMPPEAASEAALEAASAAARNGNGAPLTSSMALGPPADPWLHLLPRLGAVQCTRCDKWRLLPEAEALAADTDKKWTCASSADRRYARCEAANQISDDQMDALLALQPPRPEARTPRAEELRERLKLPDTALFTQRSTVEARLMSERACGRYEQIQDKLPVEMRRAGYYVLPNGGDGAFKEGHYAYFLPGFDGCGDHLPHFSNAGFARQWYEDHLAVRGGGGGGGGGGGRNASLNFKKLVVPGRKGRRTKMVAHPGGAASSLHEVVQHRSWVQCEEPSCGKWRVLEAERDAASLGDAELLGWTCARQWPHRHDIPQEEMQEGEEDEDYEAGDEAEAVAEEVWVGGGVRARPSSLPCGHNAHCTLPNEHGGYYNLSKRQLSSEL